MDRDLDLWQFVDERLWRGERVVLLVVADSTGSSPGRPGYKLAVAEDGELYGSIGGGVMEVNLVDKSRALLSEPGAAATGLFDSHVIEQVHQKNAPNASGMICSGRQSVILVPLIPKDSETVSRLIAALYHQRTESLCISQIGIELTTDAQTGFTKQSDTEFTYTEPLGRKPQLFIIGGGHCSLALSELMSRLDFRITILDDRPELNTIRKNAFAHKIQIIDSYEGIGELIPEGPDIYVVVMTIGYASDERAIRGLIDKDLKYFGVLGSRAKMVVLLNGLKVEGFSTEQLSRIRTPIGLPINSHTPEEIAVSIAAEIISVKNAVTE